MQPRIKHFTIPLSCEAMNHILKLEINWKPENVCIRVDSIQCIVQLQLANIQQALHEQGNYQFIGSKCITSSDSKFLLVKKVAGRDG